MHYDILKFVCVEVWVWDSNPTPKPKLRPKRRRVKLKWRHLSIIRTWQRFLKETNITQLIWIRKGSLCQRILISSHFFCMQTVIGAMDRCFAITQGRSRMLSHPSSIDALDKPSEGLWKSFPQFFLLILFSAKLCVAPQISVFFYQQASQRSLCLLYLQRHASSSPTCSIILNCMPRILLCSLPTIKKNGFPTRLFPSLNCVRISLTQWLRLGTEYTWISESHHPPVSRLLYLGNAKG